MKDGRCQDRRRCRISVALGFVLSLIGLTPAHGAETAIQPFGRLAWADSVVDVLVKVGEMGPPETVKLNDVALDSFSREELRRRVIEQLGRAPHPPRAVSSFDKPVVQRPVVIVTADPVLVAGISMKLTVRLELVPALLLDIEERHRADLGASFYLPYVVSSVQLRSTSPSIEDHFLELKEALLAKYGSSALKTSKKTYFDIRSSDSRGASVQAKVRTDRPYRECEIVYRNSRETEELKRTWQRRLQASKDAARKETERSKSAGSVDRKSDL